MESNSGHPGGRGGNAFGAATGNALHANGPYARPAICGAWDSRVDEVMAVR